MMGLVAFILICTLIFYPIADNLSIENLMKKNSINSEYKKMSFDK